MRGAIQKLKSWCSKSTGDTMGEGHPLSSGRSAGADGFSLWPLKGGSRSMPRSSTWSRQPQDVVHEQPSSCSGYAGSSEPPAHSSFTTTLSHDSSERLGQQHTSTSLITTASPGAAVATGISTMGSGLRQPVLQHQDQDHQQQQQQQHAHAQQLQAQWQHIVAAIHDASQQHQPTAGSTRRQQVGLPHSMPTLLGAGTSRPRQMLTPLPDPSLNKASDSQALKQAEDVDGFLWWGTAAKPCAEACHLFADIDGGLCAMVPRGRTHLPASAPLPSCSPMLGCTLDEGGEVEQLWATTQSIDCSLLARNSHRATDNEAAAAAGMEGGLLSRAGGSGIKESMLGITGLPMLQLDSAVRDGLNALVEEQCASDVGGGWEVSGGRTTRMCHPPAVLPGAPACTAGSGCTYPQVWGEAEVSCARWMSTTALCAAVCPVCTGVDGATSTAVNGSQLVCSPSGGEQVAAAAVPTSCTCSSAVGSQILMLSL